MEKRKRYFYFDVKKFQNKEGNVLDKQNLVGMFIYLKDNFTLST